MPAIREDDLPNYQSEILFLLIGKNPLPNYVAAKLLIKQGAKVYFVYSEDGTKDYKKRLVDKLKMQLGGSLFTPVDVPLQNPSDAACIKSAIKTVFASIPDNASIGLNYTGGTKAMSVHVYRAIEEFGTAKNCQLKFSYLDPRKLEMLFDGETDGIELNKPGDAVFEQVKILLGDLMNLHDLIYLKNESGNSVKPKESPLFPKLCKTIANFQFDRSKLNSWLNWRKNNRNKLEEPERLENLERWRKISKSERLEKLGKLEIEIPDDLSELEIAINETSQQVCSTDWVEDNKLKFALVGEQRAKTVGNFIFSFWLESYVLLKIIEVKDTCNLNQNSFGRNLAVVRSDAIDKTAPFFEVDVFALRGYQLFAVSCTTDVKKKPCKQKLFEIVHRAKQLGGDEARIGLVCMAEPNTVNEIENELKEDHVRVFGKGSLEKWNKGDLSDLGKWFKGE